MVINWNHPSRVSIDISKFDIELHLQFGSKCKVTTGEHLLAIKFNQCNKQRSNELQRIIWVI